MIFLMRRELSSITVSIRSSTFRIFDSREKYHIVLLEPVCFRSELLGGGQSTTKPSGLLIHCETSKYISSHIQYVS